MEKSMRILAFFTRSLEREEKSLNNGKYILLAFKSVVMHSSKRLFGSSL